MQKAVIVRTIDESSGEFVEIQAITVAAEHCFGPDPLRLEELAKVNFVFAPNGSGKTTISKALSEQPSDPSDRQLWPVAPTDLAIRVFNEAYRESVLTEHVGGIFTMGAESKEVNDQIGALEAATRAREAERKKWQDDIGSEDNTQAESGFLGVIAQERDLARDAVFEAHKTAPETARQIIFKGFRGDATKFLNEAVARYRDEYDLPTELDWNQLETRASTLSGDKTHRGLLPTLAMTSLISTEEVAEIAQTATSGGQGDLAPLIHRLGHEDWVSQGREYVPESDGKCPFCQVESPPDLENKLAEYFASGFDSALQRATEIHSNVMKAAAQLEDEIEALETALEADVDVDSHPCSDAISNVKTAAKLVVSQVGEKCQHPTKSYAVTDVRTLTTKLAELVAAENREVREHNRIIGSRQAELDKTIDAGWSYFLSQPAARNAIRRFNGIRSQKEGAISALRLKMERSRNEDREAADVISGLRSSISNTSEVADRINKLLAAMGFRRFKITVADTVTGGYRVVREDGTTAVDTLSEGERSFLCFAYFWESLAGSAVSGGQAEDVVAVIDDPISSLDSDSLFIVAAYIREAAMATTKGDSNVRQVIVLTHNTQFHHEAAYTSTRHNSSERHYYRLVKQQAGYTCVVDDGNRSKIRGTYPLLWEAICDSARSQDESDLVLVGVVNIVRRIIEGYFKTIGNVQDYQRPNYLDPTDERIIAMFHIWASSGSHTIADDFDQTIDIGGTKQFLRLFQRYFVLVGHESHFQMMVHGCGGDDLLRQDGLFEGFC